jgi:hypothetical protein
LPRGNPPSNGNIAGRAGVSSQVQAGGYRFGDKERRSAMRKLRSAISLAVALAAAAGPAAAQSKAPDDHVFVDGVLAVPGAPADTDTVPSKVSARNAASDKLPTVAFVLKGLTDDQRREIVQALGGRPDLALSSADVADTFVVGSEIPSRVALQALAPVPDALAAKVPELRGTGFMRAGGSLVLVDLDNSLVIGVLDR